MSLTTEQKQVAGLVKKLKANEPLTADQRSLLETYKRQTKPDAAERWRQTRSVRMDIASKPAWRQISARRAACASNLPLFIATYLSHQFTLPNSPDQNECLERIQAVALGKAGERQAQASPRGDGKSSRTLAATLWAILYGHHRYVVTIGANLDKAKKIVSEIEQELADNDLLFEDWPSICEPIRRAYSKPNRAKYLTMDGEPIRLECRTCKLVLPIWSGEPGGIGGSVIEAAGILGVRGLRHATAGGDVLRPTLALIDDPQTFETAQSLDQCDKIEQVIQGDILKMAGPRKRVSAFLNCTVIKAGDVASRFLDHKKHPEWRGIRKKLVYSWPKAKKLWEEYAEQRRSGILDGNKGAAATDFYLQHRAEMDEGAVLGWEHRFSPDNGEHSAIQHAYNTLIDDGEAAFQAEMQNEPIEKTVTVVTLTPEIVMSRINGFAPGTATEASRFTSAFIDVNRRGLAWAAVAWQANLTGNVLGYGVWPEDGRPVWSEKEPRGQTEESAVYRSLVELSERLTKPIFKIHTIAVTLDRILVDVGYLGDAVFQFLAYAHGARKWIQFGASRGRSANAFRFPAEVERLEYAFFEEWQKKGRVLVHDSDYHRMKVQESFSLQHGAPSSISLYGDSPAVHREFSKEICAEQLQQFVPSQVPSKSGLYLWTRVPGQRNEALDCLVGCRVGAVLWLARTIAVAPMTAQQQQPQAPAPAVSQPQAQPPGTSPQTSPQISYEPGWGGNWNW